MRLNLDAVSIRFKLYGVSVAMLSVMAALVAGGLFASSLVGQRVAQMNAFAGQSTRAMSIDRNIEAMTRALLRYAYDHDSDSMKAFKDGIGAVQASVQAARDEAPSEELRKTFTDLGAEVADLATDGAALEDAGSQTDAGKSKLSEAGSTLNQAARAVAKAVVKSGNPDFLLEGQKIDALLEKLRVADWRGQSRAEREAKAVLDQVAGDALDQIRKIESGDFTGAVRAATGPLKEAVAEYAQDSQAAIEAIASQGDIYRNQIAPRAQHMQALAAQAREDLANGFAQNRAAVELVNSRSSAAQKLVAAIVLLGGAVAAFLIVRSIVRPLADLTAGMRRLAEGDFEFVLPGLGDRTEIGHIVGAVEGFKRTSMARAQDQAEEARSRQAAETEALARQAGERERQAAEQALAMRELGDALAKLAQKNLAYRLETDLPEAYRKLQGDFNQAIAQLQEALVAVHGAADGVKTGAQDISKSASELASRAEQQATSLEETAASLAEITTTVRKTADGARSAREAVARTREDAQKSGEIVRRAVDAMGRIETSSQKISQIIGVIDEIAFQTNLLALNAGVEAARAGEAGRGFAVVASEVRALAQRSADAAKEIKSLISTSSQQVGDGVQLVAETGQALERILAQVAEINTVVVDIAGSAQEQAMGLEQVNAAVGKMDAITQQNAAMAEAATTSGRALTDESQQLSHLMQQFALGAKAADPLRRALAQKARTTVKSTRVPALIEPALES